jgi:hypothetical protein
MTNRISLVTLSSAVAIKAALLLIALLWKPVAANANSCEYSWDSSDPSYCESSGQQDCKDACGELQYMYSANSSGCICSCY